VSEVRVVVMDVDSTLITGEVIEMLAGHAGTRAEVTEITERAMRGELDFAASLHARVATLAGVPVTVLEDVRAEMVLTPGAESLVAELHRRGWPVGLVSGGFHELVDHLAARLGIGFVRANRLEVVDGRLTGRVTGPVVDRTAKALALRELAASHGVPMERTVAIGDGANDLDMLAAAGLGIAFNAKPVVCAQADVAVLDAPLDAVLEHLVPPAPAGSSAP
jgi:phosphoserine phosphatase